MTNPSNIAEHVAEAPRIHHRFGEFAEALDQIQARLHFACTSKKITKYATARLFSAVGKKTPTFIWFSTVGGEKGSADTERGPRGFSLKFYTEEDNWDMTGNNTPHSRSTKKSIQRGMRNCFRRCARANLLEPVTKVPRINPR